MKYTQYLLITCTFFLLTACASTGTKIDSNKLAQLAVGVTTEQEVIDTFGQPTSSTLTPSKKILIYDYLVDNGIGRGVVASTVSVVGGMVAGPFGSIAGGAASNSAVPHQMDTERLTVEIDLASKKMTNYQFQQSQ